MCRNKSSSSSSSSSSSPHKVKGGFSLYSMIYRLVINLLVFLIQFISIMLLYYSYSSLKKKINANANSTSSNSNNSNTSNSKNKKTVNIINSTNDTTNSDNNNDTNEDSDKNDPTVIISIIIPIRNNARTIGKTITTLEQHTLNKKNVEIIIVDGGGSDNTIDVAKASSLSISLKILKQDLNSDNAPNRAETFNRGASQSKGKILLFLKPDSILPYHYDDKLITTFLYDANHLVGFRVGIDRNSLQNKLTEPPALQLIEKYYDIRFWYCDLIPTNAFAIRANDFDKRKFNDMFLFEDLDFVNRIRLECLKNDNNKIVLLDDQCYINPTKYEALGSLKLTFMEILASLLFLIFKIDTKIIYKVCYDILPTKLGYRI